MAAALVDLADEALGTNVLGGYLLEEAVFDRVAKRWSLDALAIGDGGVDIRWMRERIISRSLSVISSKDMNCQY